MVNKLELVRLGAEYAMINSWKGSWHLEDRYTGEDRLEDIEKILIREFGKAYGNRLITWLKECRG